ncbi:hypothetical protein VPH35_026905 [Triticum aestivum]
MIVGLPIEGNPLCMSIDSDGRRQQMEALIGMAPPEPPEPEGDKKKERVAVGAPFTWIAWHFGNCPEEATNEEVQTYARVYIWYIISKTLFADCTGKNAPWMWLKALTVFDSKWSWGLAALAYLYKLLDDASCRISKDGCIGGCMLVLSVWSWERLPVGRPKQVAYEDWGDKHDAVRLPTWAYKWGVVPEMTDDPLLMYKQYTSGLGTITAEQVEWEPYGVGDILGIAREFELNLMCLRDRYLWLM